MMLSPSESLRSCVYELEKKSYSWGKNVTAYDIIAQDLSWHFFIFSIISHDIGLRQRSVCGYFKNLMDASFI